MADEKTLRAAMLKHLMGSTGVDEHAIRTVDALMPLVSYWMESTTLLAEEDFELISRTLRIEDEDSESTAWRKMSALNKVKSDIAHEVLP